MPPPRAAARSRVARFREGCRVNLAARFQGAVRQFPDRPALSDASGTLTYQEWDHKAQAVAAFLIEGGVAPGDRVAAFLPNSADYLVLLYGVLWAGGVLVPLNYCFGDGELTFALQDSNSRVLVIEARDLPRIDPLLAATPVRQVLVRGGTASALSAGRVPVAALADVLAAAPAAPRLAHRHDEDDCLLMYTSGTPGRPKGVHRHGVPRLAVVLARPSARGPAPVSRRRSAVHHAAGPRGGGPHPSAGPLGRAGMDRGARCLSAHFLGPRDDHAHRHESAPGTGHPLLQARVAAVRGVRGVSHPG